MAKPTILQTLLGRPSQTYSFPEEKVYFSTKQDMLNRLATDTNGSQAVIAHNDAQTTASKRNYGVRVPDTTGLPNIDQGHGKEDDDCDDEDSDRDIFYTPNTSPRTSMASTTRPLRANISPPAAVPSTKTSFTHANTSTTSISSSVLDAHSLFSFANSESTLMTSPVQSDSEQLTPRAKHSHEPPQVANGHANQQWAKDVRWLVPTTANTTPTAKATMTPKRRKADAPSKSQTRTKLNTPISKTISKATPSIMSSMAALLEEDELQDRPMLHHPRSSVLISTPRRAGSGRISSNPGHTPAVSSKRAPTSRTLHHRRSRSLGHGSHASSSSHTSALTSASSHTITPPRNSKYASSSADPYDRNTTSLPTFTAGDLPSQGTPGYTSLVLPRAPVPLSQTSQRPKGILNIKDTFHGTEVDGKVDLTRSGVAQTTMASVEVVRGLSGGSTQSNLPGKKLMNLFRRGSTSSSPSAPVPESAFGSRNLTPKEDRNGKRREGSDSPLGFTSYRQPPTYVPSGSVLVQVWAVGIDGVDRRLVFGGNSKRGVAQPSRSDTQAHEPLRTSMETPRTTPKRSVSLRSTLGRFGGSGAQQPELSSPASTPAAASYTPAAVVGYIPGRSFVGRVLECGWEVGEEVMKKGDWVVGLLDLKKCGALTEFIVVDRHRVYRTPYPRMQQPRISSSTLTPAQSSSRKMASQAEPGPSNTSRSSAFNTPSPSRNNSISARTPQGSVASTSFPLSLEELALIPACGIPAYRAVRTFAFAFSDGSTDSSVSSVSGKGVAKDALDGPRRRRVLVLRGHDGAGAMAVQMLVRRGWRVCVHVPFGCLRNEEDGLGGDGDVGGDERVEYRMRRVEERVRAWGGEEVIFDDGEEGEGEDERGAVVRVIDQLREDGDAFDAVLDTVGGKEVWEAAERLLQVLPVSGPDAATIGSPSGKKEKARRLGFKHFTTLIGDFPGRTIPSAGDNFKAGLRSLNFGVRSDGKKSEGRVGYAWVSYAQDVDWEGENIKNTLREVLRTVTDDDIRPWLGDGGEGSECNTDRTVPFEKAHEVFVSSDRGLLTNGGAVVIKVVG